MERRKVETSYGVIHVEERVARDGHPTLVLPNGIDETTANWSALVRALMQHDPDLGFVLFDGLGQGQTRGRNSFDDVPFLDQREMLHELLGLLDLPAGKRFLFGLSYGGGVAMSHLAKYPDDFQAVGAIAPFTAPLSAHDRMLRQLIENPLMPAAYSDFLYYFIAQNILFLSGNSSPGMIRMIRGAKDWNAENVIGQFPPEKFHLIASPGDPVVPIQSLRDIWEKIPPRARATWLEVTVPSKFMDAGMGAHRLTQSIPEFLAAWMMMIIQNDQAVRGDLRYEAFSPKFSATTGGFTVNLPRPCADVIKGGKDQP